MARASWKFNYMNFKIYKHIFLSQQQSELNKLTTKIFCRSSVVPKNFLRKTAFLYKGEDLVKVTFSKYTLNYKLGEFNITRKPFSFPPKKKKK